MHRSVSTVLVAGLLAVTTTTAFAQASTPRVDTRQQNQERRIDQGVASGSLTQREANRLDAGQQRVDRMENRALTDGTVTGRERARLEHAQDVQSRRIHAQRHDRQRDRDHDGRIDRPARR